MTVARLVQRPNRVGGMPTVLADGTGLLVDPEDEEGYAQH
jgi:hypothetical protein